MIKTKNPKRIGKKLGPPIKTIKEAIDVVLRSDLKKQLAAIDRFEKRSAKANLMVGNGFQKLQRGDRVRLVDANGNVVYDTTNE